VKRQVIAIVAGIGILLFLTGAVAVEVVSQFYIEPRTVSSVGEIYEHYLGARESLPPLPMTKSPLELIADMESGDYSFLNDQWYINQSGSALYVAEGSTLAKTLKLPLEIMAIEDITRGEITLFSREKNGQWKGLALFEAPPVLDEFDPYWKTLSDAEKEMELLIRFGAARVRWSAVLKPEADALGDLILQRDAAAATALLLEESGAAAMMSVPAGHANDIWVSTGSASNGLDLAVYCPAGVSNIEIYACDDLISNVWIVAAENLIATNNLIDWPCSATDNNAFFRAGNGGLDTDGDQLCDARELLVTKTSITNEDSDNDAMSDGWEVANGLNPLIADDQIADSDHDMLPNVYEWFYGLNPNGADSDLAPRLRVDPANTSASNTYASIETALNASVPYSIIEVAAGLYREQNVIFPAHPVLLMSENWGTNRCVKINSTGFSAFMLSDGQDNRTIIRGLNVNLQGSSARQFGFYLGRGSAPFVGAAPFFDGVKVQLGEGAWSAGFYGFGSTDEPIRFNNCIVRGIEAGNVLSGIYLVDAPDVQVVNCSFLNFNTSTNLSAGILLGASSGNIGRAASQISARIDNCFWDETFASNNNYAVVHASGAACRYQTGISCSVVPDSSRLLDVDNEAFVTEASGTALQDGLILSGSPCINAAGAALLSWYDFHGQPRDGTPDIGADELGVITTNDTDFDGLDDYSEAFAYQTFIFDYDSDGDGVGDGDEIHCGTDPKSETNYCVSIMGTVDDQTGLNATIRASYALGSSTWNATNSVVVINGQFSYFHQEINSAKPVIVQVLIDLDGDNVFDAGIDPFYTKALTVAGHDSGISFTLFDNDDDHIADATEVGCGTDPNNKGHYCVTLQGTVTNQSTLTGTVYAAAVLMDETMPPTPREMSQNEIGRAVVRQVAVTNDTFLLEHTVVDQRYSHQGWTLWLEVYQDASGDASLDYFEPMTQTVVSVTSHTLTFDLELPMSNYDGDYDKIPDWWEAQNGLCYTNEADAFADPDGDWIDNLWEYRLELDPQVYNTNNYAFADAMRAVDSRIEGIEPFNAIKIYTTQNHSAGIYERNTNCWAADIDLTCCSPWNSYASYKRAGTLVSPRHALFVNHINYGLSFWVPENNTLRFVDSTNGVYTAIIDEVHHLVTTNADITIAVLHDDVPTNRFHCAKILPGNFTNYLGHLNIHIPGLCLDQEEKALVHNLDKNILAKTYGIEFGTDCSFTIPVCGPRTNYYDLNEDLGIGKAGLRSGDSGNPGFVILNDEPILLTLWVRAGGGSGSAITTFKDDINDVLNLTGYSLTEVDLSGYDVIPGKLR
jgi:hypothetical protein